MITDEDRKKLLTAGDKLEKNARELYNHSNLHIDEPEYSWFTKRVFCDSSLERLKKHLQKVKTLLPITPPTKTIHKGKNSLSALANDIQKEATTLCFSFYFIPRSAEDEAEKPKRSHGFLPGPKDYNIHYNLLLARIEQFENLYEKIKQDRSAKLAEKNFAHDSFVLSNVARAEKKLNPKKTPNNN